MVQWQVGGRWVFFYQTTLTCKVLVRVLLTFFRQMISCLWLHYFGFDYFFVL